jgi:hypothetical protein
MNKTEERIRPGVFVFCFVLLACLFWFGWHLTKEDADEKAPARTAISSSMITSVVSNMKPVVEATENEEQKGEETNAVPEWVMGSAGTNPGVTKVAFRADKNDLHDQLTRRLEEVRQKNNSN